MCESRIYLRWGGEAGKREASERRCWPGLREAVLVLCPELVALVFAFEPECNTRRCGFWGERKRSRERACARALVGGSRNLELHVSLTCGVEDGPNPASHQEAHCAFGAFHRSLFSPREHGREVLRGRVVDDGVDCNSGTRVG